MKTMLSKHALDHRMNRATDVRIQMPIGAKVRHAELGLEGEIVAKLDDGITGLALYIFRSWDGVERRTVRALLDRIKPNNR